MADAEAPLRRDVRLLGEILGRVLVEQEGEELLETEERIRALVPRGRERRAAPRDDLRDGGARARPRRGRRTVLRAFALYFQLANLAEQHHRLRRRREYEREQRIAARVARRGVRALEAAGVARASSREAAADLARARADRAPDRGGPSHDPRRPPAARRAASTSSTTRRCAPASASRVETALAEEVTAALADRRGARAAPARRRRDPQRALVLRAEPARRRADGSLAEYRARLPGAPRAAALRQLDRRRPGRQPDRRAARRSRRRSSGRARSRSRATATRCARSRPPLGVSSSLVGRLAPSSRRRSRATSASCPSTPQQIGAQNEGEPYRRKLSFVWWRLGNDGYALAGRARSPTSTCIDRSLRAQPRRAHRRRPAGRAAPPRRALRLPPRQARRAPARARPRASRTSACARRFAAVAAARARARARRRSTR